MRDRASRTSPSASPGPGLLARVELGQRLASFAVAVRGSAQPVVRALKVAVLAQDDAEIALGRGVIRLGRAVEPLNRGLGVVALPPEQASQCVCALGVGRGAPQRRLGGVDLAPLPEQHAEPVRGADVTQFRGRSEPAFGCGEVGVAEPLPERERRGAVSGIGGRLELLVRARHRVGVVGVPGRRRVMASLRIRADG